MIINYNNIAKGQENKFELDGRSYSIFVADYNQNRGFATCILRDNTNNARYFIDNRLELNGHTFMSYFGYTWDYNRNNLVGNTSALCIFIDQ